MLPNRCEVQLPTVKHGHIPKTKVGRRGKRSLLKYCTIWENGRHLDSRPIFSVKHRKKSICSQNDWSPKPCPEICPILICPSEHKAVSWTALCLQAPCSPCMGPKTPLPATASHTGASGPLPTATDGHGHIGTPLCWPRGSCTCNWVTPAFRAHWPMSTPSAEHESQRKRENFCLPSI